jgi:hypothetical protein
MAAESSAATEDEAVDIGDPPKLNGDYLVKDF